jgi:glucose-1-phosphate thymidylyltransferase
MKAVILSGGLGTRMMPATSVANKHLLPLYSSQGAVPMIYYPIATLVKSGITDILVVSSREHCGKIIENLSDGHDFGANFTYKIQDIKHVELGIASALKLAEDFVNENKFAVILGDNYFENTFAQEFIKFEMGNKEAAIFVKEVSDPHRFGILSSENGTNSIEEKPQNPKSNLAVTGLYCYSPHVFQIAKTLVKSKRGELEITDINNYYLNNMDIHNIQGFWSDMGTPESLLRTQDFLSKQ